MERFEEVAVFVQSPNAAAQRKRGAALQGAAPLSPTGHLALGLPRLERGASDSAAEALPRGRLSRGGAAPRPGDMPDRAQQVLHKRVRRRVGEALMMANLPQLALR